MQGAASFALVVAAMFHTADLRIHDVQGAAHLSPLSGQEVSDLEGIVTALWSDGFYMQDPAPDGDDATSEAIRVSARSAVNVGDVVRIAGVVHEVRAGCTTCSPADDAFANLTTTEVTSTALTLVAHRADLPAPGYIGPAAGERSPPGAVIEDD